MNFRGFATLALGGVLAPMLLSGAALAQSKTMQFGSNTVGCKDSNILQSAEYMRVRDDPKDVGVLLSAEINDGRCSIYKAGDVVAVEDSERKTGMSLVRIVGSSTSFWVHTRTLNPM